MQRASQRSATGYEDAASATFMPAAAKRPGFATMRTPGRAARAAAAVDGVAEPSATITSIGPG